MKDIFFWQSWDKTSRIFFQMYLLIIFFSAGNLLYGYFFGIENAIGWEIFETLQKIKLPLPEFGVGNFKVSPQIDSYTLQQYLQGSVLKIHPANSYIFLTFLVLGLNLILSLLPSIKKLWFYIGLGIFIVFGISLRLENIYLFGTPDKTGLIILLSVYLSIAYIFHEIKKDIPLVIRFAVFTGVSIIFGVFIWMFSEVGNPFVYITNYSIIVPIFLSTLFIIIISHEIIFGILYVVTHHNTRRSAHSLAHFLILSTIYLLYVTLSYLWYAKIVKIEFWFVNPFLLFTLSAIIGLYGFKRRDFVYRDMMPFKPIGGLMYLALALISFSTMAYAFNSANDPLIETFEDIIFYGHMAYGAMFFFYIIANFFATLIQNYKVSKIVYKPEYYPFHIFRIMGMITMIALFLRANMIVLSQSQSGYNIGIADIHLLNDELRLAEEYYNIAGAYVYQNHRSNYSLASLSRIQRDKTSEAFYLENAILKNPSEHAVISLSNLFLKNNRYWQGLFKLEEGLKHFPNSSAINNNAGYFYSKTDITDSSFYYYNKSYQNREWADLAGSNIFGLFAQESIPVNPDSISLIYPNARSYAATGNLLALKNQRTSNTYSYKPFDLQSSPLTTAQFVYYYNLCYERMNKKDTSYLSILNSVIENSRSVVQEYRLAYLKSIFLYYTGRKGEAFREMNDLAYGANNTQDYNRLLGIWSLQSASPKLSVEYFEKAGFGGDPEYDFYALIAHMEMGDLKKADSLSDKFDTQNGGDLQNEKSNIKRILKIKDLNSEIFPDIDKYQILRYRTDLFKSEKEIHDYIKTIDNEIIRSLVKIELAEKYYKYGDFNKSNQYLSSVGKSNSDIPELAKRISLLELKIANSRQDIHGITSGIEDFKQKFVEDVGYLNLFQAKLYSVGGDSAKADVMYRSMAGPDPFFEEAIIDAAEYFYKKGIDAYYAYNTYLKALEINPYSVPLLKAFAHHCVEINLTDYARDALRDLEHLWPEEYHSLFVKEIEDKILRIESERLLWTNESM